MVHVRVEGGDVRGVIEDNTLIFLSISLSHRHPWARVMELCQPLRS